MIDFDILQECGTTPERLRAFFTATMPTPKREAELKATAGGRQEFERMKTEVKRRKDFEDMIGSWLQENIVYSLRNHHMHSAADMAWDSAPINKHNIPLLQYAQGRIDSAKLDTALKDIPNGETFVKKNDSGKTVGIDLPKFTEMNVNLVRSVISRRVAAQTVKYQLWPWFKYEPRDGTQMGRLRADMTSQRMDIMGDQYGYEAFQEQICRDMLLYPNGSIAFPRCSWEREVQWQKKPVAEEFQTTDGKIPKESVVVREGVSWINPHPSRVFYDTAYPLSSLNTDTGCEYVGFWDVDRWGNIRRNPMYFNHDKVSFSEDTAAWFTQYPVYFNQFFDTITPPTLPQSPAAENDRKNQVGLYSTGTDDVSTFISNLWLRVTPTNWGWGTYPFPVWVHLKTAGDNTVVFADFMPSSAAAVARFNCNDGRLNNISMAHELMQFQDQLTNLYSQLLQTIQADLFAVAVLNEDVFPDTDEGRKVRDEFRAIMKGNKWSSNMQVLSCSFEKLSSVLGKEITADMVFKVVRSSPNTAITAIFEAITRVIAMAERLMVLGAQEQAQSSPHEISATESNQMAQSTDTIYSYISAALDRFRSAQKRICYESMIACASDDVSLPVAKRYPKSMITKAGFQVISEDEDDQERIGFVRVAGRKSGLVHDYIYTNRDGGNRASNTAAATALVQLLTPFITSNPSAQNAILSAMGKEKLFELMNAVFRLADAGVDLNLEVKPGDGDELLLEDDKQVMGMLQQLAQAVKQNTQDVAQIKSLVTPGAPQLQPQPAAPTMGGQMQPPPMQ